MDMEILDGAGEKECRENYWTMLAESFQIPCEHPQKQRIMPTVPDNVKISLSTGHLNRMLSTKVFMFHLFFMNCQASTEHRNQNNPNK